MGNTTKLRHFEFESIDRDYNFYYEMNNLDKNSFIKQGLELRYKEIDETLPNYLPAYKDRVQTNMNKLKIGTTEELLDTYSRKHIYDNPVFFTNKYLNYQNINEEEFENIQELYELVSKNEGAIINAFHTDLYQIIPYALASFLENIGSSKKVCIVGPELSLSILKNMDSKYHKQISNLDYLYIDDMDDNPYPLLLKSCLKKLENGNLLYILPEISFGFNTTNHTVFLGRKVKLPLGSTFLSQTLDVPIIVMYSIINASNENKIYVHKPNYPSNYMNDKKQNQYAQAQDIFKVLEKVVTKYPTSWIGFESFNMMEAENNG